jgi:hypothetical protein
MIHFVQQTHLWVFTSVVNWRRRPLLLRFLTFLLPFRQCFQFSSKGGRGRSCTITFPLIYLWNCKFQSWSITNNSDDKTRHFQTYAFYRFIFRFVVSSIHSKLRINTCAYEQTRNDCVNNIHLHTLIITFTFTFCTLLYFYVVAARYEINYHLHIYHIKQLPIMIYIHTYISNGTVHIECAQLSVHNVDCVPLCFHLQRTNMDKTSIYPTYSLFCTTFTLYVSFRT